MRTITLNRSLLVSIVLHLFIVLILSITLPKNPFLEQQQPILVNIDSPTKTMASGLEKVLDKPVSQNTPELTERMTKSVEKSPVNKKIKQSVNDIKPKTQSIKQELKKSVKSRDSINIKKEIEKTDLPANKPKAQKYTSADEALDDFFDKEEKSPVQNKQENTDLSKTIDSALNQVSSTGTKANNQTSAAATPGSSDPLNDAAWSTKPRKTLFFPDIQSKIPAEYQKKGMGYSVKVKIAFDMNGLAVRVDLLESSGDAVIDNLFLTELRKIRVEPSSTPGIDEISKTFTISVK